MSDPTGERRDERTKIDQYKRRKKIMAIHGHVSKINKKSTIKSKKKVVKKK